MKEIKEKQSQPSKLELITSLSSLPLYYPIDANRAQYATNAIDIAVAESPSFRWARMHTEDDMVYLIIPQAIAAKDGVAYQTRLIGKGGIQNVKIPIHTLLPSYPCSSCGGAIEPVFDSPKAKVIACNYCEQPNPAEWTTKVREQMIQLLNPFRGFDEPIRGKAQDVARKFHPLLLAFRKSPMETSILDFGDSTPVSVYAFRSTSSQWLEEHVAISIGEPQTEGPPVDVVAQSGLYTRGAGGAIKLRPVQDMLMEKEDCERIRAEEAELRIVDQLQTLWVLLNDTSGELNPFGGQKSLIDELLEIHQNFTKTEDNYEEHLTSEIPLMMYRGSPLIDSVFDSNSRNIGKTNMICINAYDRGLSIVLDPRKPLSFSNHREVAKILIKYKLYDLHLPINIREAKMVRQFQEDVEKSYQELMERGWLGNWVSYNDFTLISD